MEQAADTGVMFKEMKRITNNTENQHPSNNSVFNFINSKLNELDGSNGTNTITLKLQNHKRKAILSTVSKLPIATSRAYSDNTIKTAFILNGQLDIAHKLVPSLSNLMHTYRGDIEGTSWYENREQLLGKFYEEAFTTGMVSKTTLQLSNIPVDMNSQGEVVNRDVGIQLENRQRSKILSCDIQIQSRRDYLFQMKMKEHSKAVILFKTEDKIYQDNKICESKIFSIFMKEFETTNNTSSTATLNHPIPSERQPTCFGAIADILTYNFMLKCKAQLKKDEMLCFVQTRSEKRFRAGKVSYLNVPKNKPEIFECLWKLHNAAQRPRMFPTYPLEPQES